MATTWATSSVARPIIPGSASCPEVVLPDLDGSEFHLSSLRGKKVVVVDDRDAAIEKKAAKVEQDNPELAARMRGGQDRDSYPDAIRDWAHKGADSSFVMTPAQVLEASTDCGVDKSEGAAHFELANHLWTAGDRDGAIEHFNHAHRLQPENWTYKCQAWSLVGNENAGGGELGRFNQGPLPGAEADWPFAGNFTAEASKTPAGDYYPKTL